MGVISDNSSNAQRQDAVKQRTPSEHNTYVEETPEDVDAELRRLLRNSIPECEEQSMNPTENSNTGNDQAFAQDSGHQHEVVATVDETEAMLDELDDGVDDMDEDEQDLGHVSEQDGGEVQSVSELHKVDVTVMVTVPLDEPELAGMRKNLSKVELGGHSFDFYRPFRPAKPGSSSAVGAFRSIMVPLFRKVNDLNQGSIMYVGDAGSVGDSIASVMEAIETEVGTSLDSIGDPDDVISVLSGDEEVEAVEPVEEGGDFDYDAESEDHEDFDEDSVVVTVGNMLGYSAWLNSSSDNVHNIVIQLVVQNPSLYDAEDKGNEVSKMVKFFNTLKDRECGNINLFLSFGVGVDNMLQSEVRGGMIDSLLDEEFQVYTPSHADIIGDGNFEVELPLPMDAEDFEDMMGASAMMFVKHIGQEQVDD